MKKSSQITLGLLASVAVVVNSGCRRTQPQNCVGEANTIVADQYCDEADRQRRMNPGMRMPYRWIFGGSSGGHFGDSVFGGSTEPWPGTTSVRSSGVKTGGFGSFFGGHGGGAAGHGGGAGE